jgi:hypothetical protein
VRAGAPHHPGGPRSGRPLHPLPLQRRSGGRCWGRRRRPPTCRGGGGAQAGRPGWVHVDQLPDSRGVHDLVLLQSVKDTAAGQRVASYRYGLRCSMWSAQGAGWFAYTPCTHLRCARVSWLTRDGVELPMAVSRCTVVKWLTMLHRDGCCSSTDVASLVACPQVAQAESC